MNLKLPAPVPLNASSSPEKTTPGAHAGFRKISRIATENIKGLGLLLKSFKLMKVNPVGAALVNEQQTARIATVHTKLCQVMVSKIRASVS